MSRPRNELRRGPRRGRGSGGAAAGAGARGGSGRCPATRHVPSSRISSTSRAVTSRAVSTLIRLWSSTSARSRTSPGRRSNCARLSFVVEVRAARARAARSGRSGTNSSRPPIRAFEPDTGGRASPRSSRATTSSTRPSRSPCRVEQRAPRHGGQVNDRVGHRPKIVAKASAGVRRTDTLTVNY